MIRKRSSTAFFLVIFFFSAALLFPGDEPAVKAGVCRLESTGGDVENLAAGLSGRLYEALNGIRHRQLEYSEIISILNRDKIKELSAKKLALDKHLKERDELLFNKESVSSSKKKINEKNVIIEKTRSEIVQLEEEILTISEGIGRDTVSLQPVAILSPDEGNFFLKKPGAVEFSADSYGLDLLIYGTLETVDDYIIISINVWNNLIEKDVIKWQTAARFNEVNKYIDPGIEKILEGIMGRKWSYISVETGGNGLIYVDNMFAGVGKVENIRVESGEHTVSARSPGYMDAERAVKMGPGQRETIRLELAEDESKDIIIQTFPRGADLYIDSEWKGVTPSRLNITEFPAAVRIKKVGWMEKKMFLSEQDGSLVNINLKPEIIERKSLIDDTRNRFYNSFGGAIMSIPLTAWMYSMVEQTADAYNREYAANGPENLDELIRLRNLNQMQYGLYIGAIGLNIFLFLDTIIRGVEYINSVDYDSN